MAANELFNLLCDKRILAILDGDKNFGSLKIGDTEADIPISMPYLSGPMICDISSDFGYPMEYNWGGGGRSRWEYLNALLSHCIQTDRISDLLAYLFSMGQFSDRLKGNSPKVIESAHKQIVDTVMGRINGILYFGGNELVCLGSAFTVRKIGSTVSVAAPTVRTIDREYIIDLSDRAMEDINDGNFDSAITKSRTVLEEVFCYVIEKKGETPSESGDISKLYNQVKQLYNMHQNHDLDKRINGLLSGLEKILSSIAEMRNKGSDSHGVGSKRIKISDYHARLFVNSAVTMADFILSVSINALSEQSQ